MKVTAETSRKVIVLVALGIVILLCAHTPYLRYCGHDLLTASEYAGYQCGNFLWQVVPWSLGVIVLAYAAWVYVSRPRPQ